MTIQDSNICPISFECGLAVPRRSIDIPAIDGCSGATLADPCTASEFGTSLSARSSSGVVPLPSGRLNRAYSAAAPAGAMSTGPTPARYLTSDERLNVSSLMKTSPHAQSSNTMPRMGSMRFSRASSRPASSQKHIASSAAVLSAICASSDAAVHSHRGLATDNTEPLPQLTPQQQRLAEACRSRDFRALHQALGTTGPASVAIDNNGNTALHLLLLPPPATAQSGQHAETLHHVPSTGSLGSAVVQQSSSGAFGWLTSCFGGSKHSIVSSNLSVADTQSVQPAASAAMVAALLTAGADVNIRNQDGLTPIMLAVQQLVHLLESNANSNKVAAALRVLDLHCKQPLADLNMKDSLGRTALALLMLPAAGSCFNAVCDATAHTEDCSLGGRSAAMTGSAAAAGLSSSAAAAQLKAVQMLVHSGADINAADHNGLTILMHAASQPAVTKELLQLLLESGANPLTLDNKRRSALAHALVAQQMKLLPAVGPVFGKWQQSVAAHHAAISGAGGGVGYNSNCPKQMGPTSASSFAAGAVAAAGHNLDKVAAAGSSCSSPASVSDAPSSLASGSIHSQEPSSKHLYSTYVSPFPLPSHGPVIRALCSYGGLDLCPASINTRFPALEGYSQLHIAMRRGDPRAQELLLAGGADVNALDTWGNSPLMYWPVAPTEPPELVERLVAALLRHGADANLPNNDGWTPLDLACELDKFGKVHVKPKCVPVHALLVGYGAKNSDAFMNQHRNQPTMMCLRTDSANSVLRMSRSFDSLRVVVSSLADTEDYMMSNLSPCCSATYLPRRLASRLDCTLVYSHSIHAHIAPGALSQVQLLLCTLAV